MRHVAGLFCCFVLFAGCAAEAYRDAAGESTTAPAAAQEPAFGGEAAEEGGDRTAAPDGVKPRIIYSADVRLVAEDFAAAAEELTALVNKVGGYVASASLDRSSGESRYGQWTVRVPVGAYERFLGSLDSIGFVETRSQTSQDVTMEYVDVEARVANLKRLEERFVKLLDERTGKLEDVLKVEQELARVRGEIEQAEGRLRYLTNKTDYGTVTVHLREERDYVPPKAPTFGEQVATTWGQSLRALRRAAEGTALALVAAAPWLAVALVPVAAGGWSGRTGGRGALRSG